MAQAKEFKRTEPFDRRRETFAKVYMAGSLYTAAEQTWNAELCRYLRRMRCAVFLPQAEVDPNLSSPAGIFEACLRGVLWSDVVVACADGPDVESGTSFECGVALDKRPIVLYRTDFRRGGEPKNSRQVNLMISEASSEIVVSSQNFAENVVTCVGAKIYSAVERLKRRGFLPKVVDLSSYLETEMT